MKLARAVLLILLCLLGGATTARADSTIPPPAIEKVVPYSYALYVNGSSDPAASGVRVYSGATCADAAALGTRHYRGDFSTGLDGSWSGYLYEDDSPERAFVATAWSSSGRESEPSACITTSDPPTVSASGQTVDDNAGSIHVIFTRTATDGHSFMYVDTVEGTAHESSDYSPVHGGYVGFDRGQSTASVDISVVGGKLAGTSKSFGLRLHDPAGAVIAEPSTPTYTVRGTAHPRLALGPHLSDFGAVATSDAAGRTTRLTVYSHGPPATVRRVGLSGSPGFDIVRNGCRVGSQVDFRRACDIYVRFRPKAQGRFQTSLVIETDAPTVTVPYIGTGGRVGYACTNDYEYPAERDPRNPLMLPNHVRTSPDPLTGAKFFVDSESGLGVADLKRLRTQHRFGDARLLERIAKQPETKRFSRFTRTGGYRSVRQLMCRVPVQHPGSIPLLSLYRLEHEHCGNYNGDSATEQAAYRTFVDDFARGVGRFPVVVFYEFDSIITTPCLNRHGLAIRLAELRYGIEKLSQLPHAVVYLDAGAADALPYRQTASLLNRVGLKSIQGFFLNSTHYDSTRNEIAYGQKISRLVGGKHFVVSTAVNGRGPLRSRNPSREGNTVLCNPPGRGLGTRPTTHTRNGLVDAFAWIGNPGRSGGRCHRGDAQNGYWDLRYALSLARYARY